MQKHLVSFGNSLGIVIDRPICKIEPVAAPAILPAVQLDARRVVFTVADNMPWELHERLHPEMKGRGSCVLAVSWAERVMRDPRPGGELFVRRYQRLLDAKRAGSTWEEAVATAVSEVPVPG